VLGVTATAPGAAASGGASAGRVLALTGSDPQLSAAAALAAVVAGILLSLAVRRRRP
jgi:membrane-associated PAP2 superfamily phosphatase